MYQFYNLFKINNYIINIIFSYSILLMYNYNQKKQKIYKKKTTKKNNKRNNKRDYKRNYKTKKIRKTKKFIGKNITRKILTGGGHKYFTMDFPAKTKKTEHAAILQNMFSTNPTIERNNFTQDLGIITTIIIDGDFAKNDCDDMWALAFLSKNIGKINNEGQQQPTLICGSLNGGINIKAIAESDLNIMWNSKPDDNIQYTYNWNENDGSVQNRTITNLRGSVLIYILGGINKEEVKSYKSLLDSNSEVKFCFIFQSPSNWNGVKSLDEKEYTLASIPSNVRSGKKERDAIREAVNNYIELINILKSRANVLIVFTDFERDKRFYNIVYPLALYTEEELLNSPEPNTLPMPSFTKEIVATTFGGKPIISDFKFQSNLNTYINELPEYYKPYHTELTSYDEMLPKRPEFITNTEDILRRRDRGTFIADLYTMYASLTSDKNIIYTGLTEITLDSRELYSLKSSK